MSLWFKGKDADLFTRWLQSAIAIAQTELSDSVLTTATGNLAAPFTVEQHDKRSEIVKYRNALEIFGIFGTCVYDNKEHPLKIVERIEVS